MLERPVPQTVHVVRVFLGLVGYYRHFICYYDSIATPLTKLTCNDDFRWSTEAAEAFCALQRTLTKAPVLPLLSFDAQAFIFYCDASDSLFSAVLHQGGRSVAFFSRQIVPWHAKLATYEGELIGLV
jgi:hypothetical protein